MKPTIKVKCLVMAAITVASGCSPIKPMVSKEETDKLVKDALREQVTCERKHVAEVDDRTSDASTVALALSLRCNSEYQAVTQAAGTGLDNDVQRRMLREKRNSQAQRIESFLPTVMQYRASAK